MLKKIPVKQLRLGMYIHELGCSWMEHPFWSKTFLLDDPKDLSTLLSTQIKIVHIDTSKGLDVEIQERSTSSCTDDSCTPSDTDNCKKCWRLNPEQAYKTEPAVEISPPPVATVPRVSTAQEVDRAALICAQSKQAVASMFQESRMGHALNTEEALSVVDEISNSVLRNSGALISLARLKNKDDYTYMHSVAVCALMVSLAKQLKLDSEQIRQAGLAGLLHDIGKMMIPPEILNKPGKLTDAEFLSVKNHPSEGHKMLLESGVTSDMTLDVCLHHHEKVDGSGYPERLAAEQISLYAKMGAVCDVYDAITSNRPYKNGWEPADSLRKMAEWSNGHFDQRIFEAFVHSIGIYPISSLVQLGSGRLGVVIEQSEKSLLTPIVKVFFSIKSNCRIQPEIMDLSLAGCKDKITSFEDPAKWNIPDIHELWSGIVATH